MHSTVCVHCETLRHWSDKASFLQEQRVLHLLFEQAACLAVYSLQNSSSWYVNVSVSCALNADYNNNTITCLSFDSLRH